MNEPLLALRDVEVCRGPRRIAAARRLSLQEGEILALIGPNGAGKSTLLGVASTLLRPTKGEVLYRGAPVPQRRGARLALRRRFGCVFQEPLLLDRTAAQNVALPLELRGVSKKQAVAKATQWLERLSIAHLRDQDGRTLSGGEAQRVSLARTLIAGPEIVFLDEPLAALDTPTRERMMTELPDLLRDTAAVLVTHDHGEARRLASKVAVMLNGEVTAHGFVSDVFFRPANLELARFLGVENLIPARRRRDEVVLPGGETLRYEEPSALGPDVVVCLRAESVRVGVNGARGDDIRLRGRIESVAPRAMGHAVAVGFGGFSLEARAFAGDAERYRLEPGELIDVHFQRKLLHLLSGQAA